MPGNASTSQRARGTLVTSSGPPRRVPSRFRPGSTFQRGSRHQALYSFLIKAKEKRPGRGKMNVRVPGVHYRRAFSVDEAKAVLLRHHRKIAPERPRMRVLRRDHELPVFFRVTIKS